MKIDLEWIDGALTLQIRLSLPDAAIDQVIRHGDTYFLGPEYDDVRTLFIHGEHAGALPYMTGQPTLDDLLGMCIDVAAYHDGNATEGKETRLCELRRCLREWLQKAEAAVPYRPDDNARKETA